MNIISRRSFLERCTTAGAGLGLAALYNVPPFIKRALAASGIGTNGKKILFIFLRGANDGLNALIPHGDASYNLARTPVTGDTPLALPSDAGAGGDAASYTATGGKIGATNPLFNATTGGIEAGDTTGVYDAYPYRIACRDGFSALHPSHKFLLPIYNNGDLALVHRVGYARQSRSHFDSQNYWENGIPGNNVKREGIFYRTMFASGLANTQALTGVSFQSALPLILQGSGAAMTNLSSPTRYDLLGIPANLDGNNKVDRALSNANFYPFAQKDYRDLVKLQYKNLNDTLQIFAQMKFSDADNKFFDSTAAGNATDGDQYFYTRGFVRGSDTKPQNQGYWLFPHNQNSDGGWVRPHASNPLDPGTLQGNKYVLQTANAGGGDYNFMRNVKAAAMVLNYTNAICAGTEFGGFDTHNNQIPGGTNLDGQHARLQRHIAWAMYSLYKYFTLYGAGGPKVNDPSLPANMPTALTTWNDLVVVTLSEFGRTSVQNSTLGTDHAEAGLMWVAGGAVKGLIPGATPADPNVRNGIFAFNNVAARATYNGVAVNYIRKGDTRLQGGTADYVAGSQTGTGSLFDATGRYLHRAVDFRSVLGEIIRDHLGATQTQLDYIIPGYTVAGEKLKLGGSVSTAVDPTGTIISGELDLV